MASSKSSFKEHPQSNGVTDVPGFQAAGVGCDIREKGDTSRRDLALVYSEKPCAAAATFTQNVFAAAPVLLCRQVLASKGPIHAIVANSGNANAATGRQGMTDALAMQEATAKACGVDPAGVFVCSTGRIGRAMPMPKVLQGIQAAGQTLSNSPEQGSDAAWAILTSDTREKVVTVSFSVSDETVTVSGFAKGAGMIEPNMATMLAFLGTDAAIAPEFLQKILLGAVDDSFNAVTVDGDQSTNDTVIALANGVSGVVIEPGSPVAEAFTQAVRHVCAVLADKIVGDGERISKVVELKVEGAKDRSEGEKVARAIGNSLLVKTSWYGNDPNWGRVLDAAGYAGVAFDPDAVELFYQAAGSEPVMAFQKGEGQHANLPKWKEIVKAARFTILLKLHRGEASYRLLASDLTEGYVDFNKSE